MNESEIRALQRNLAAAARRRLVDQEQIARQRCLVEQLELWGELLQSFDSRKPQIEAKSDHDRVFEANRKLISNDLIEELYGTIRQQREQIKQLLSALSLMNDRIKQQRPRSR